LGCGHIADLHYGYRPQRYKFQPFDHIEALAAIMHHASRFCPPGWRTYAVDPSEAVQTVIGQSKNGSRRSIARTRRAAAGRSRIPRHCALPATPGLSPGLARTSSGNHALLPLGRRKIGAWGSVEGARGRPCYSPEFPGGFPERRSGSTGSALRASYPIEHQAPREGGKAGPPFAERRGPHSATHISGAIR
jgi:hypothetical protein